MIGARWTAEEDAILLREAEAGTSYKAIASRFGRTPVGVLQRAYILGVAYRRRPWSEHEDRQLREELATGVSYRDIAVRHGRTVNAIRVHACLSGLTRREKETTR